jgi:VWFA-related protein
MKWIAFFIFLATLAVAQSSASQPPTSTQSPVVSIPFFAEDEHGDPLDTIAQGDLAVIDNKKPAREVVSLRVGKDSPLRLGVLIDNSGSEKQSKLYVPGVRALADFMKEALAGPEDRIFVVTSSPEPKATDFMSKEAFTNFDINLKTGGGTSLWDGLDIACRKRMGDDAGRVVRRVLVLLSDGEDDQSHPTHEQAVAIAEETGTVVFAVSTSEDANAPRANRALKELADRTGGRACLHLKQADLAKAFSNVMTQIESMYVVSYVPTDAVRPNERRSVELRLASSQKVKLRAPRTYRVAPSQN